MDQNMYERNNSQGYYEAPVNPQRRTPDGSELEEPVSVGEWLITLLLMMIPCVNLVLMFVWAFGGSAKKSKSNYFKASLIWAGISVIFMIVLTVLLAAGVVAGMSGLA